MCGRYTIATDAEALAARFHAEVPASLISPSYNAAPSQSLPTRHSRPNARTSIMISRSTEIVELTMALFATFWVNGHQHELLSLRT